MNSKKASPAVEYFSYSRLSRIIKKVFRKLGLSKEHTDIARDVLLAADFKGIDSHGIARLKLYVELIQSNRVNINPNLKLVHETPSTANIDGDNGLGLIVAPKAMEIAIQKANQVGVGLVAVHHSTHYGIASYHAELALDKEMIGIAMTNTTPLVAATYGTERLIGTNPIAFVAPADKEASFSFDLSTSVVPNGKLQRYAKLDQLMPEGWAQDQDGKPTRDPNILAKGGSLLPLGGYSDTHGGHKGYALSSMVDILSGVLSGANFGAWVPPFFHFQALQEQVGKGVGHFLGAMRIDAFRKTSEFKKDMDKWIRKIRQGKTIPGKEKILIPGDLEKANEIRRKQEGVPLVKKIRDELNELLEQLDIPIE